MKNLILLILLIFLILLPFKEIIANDGGIEDIFDYGAGARAMGLGNSYVSVADDSSAIFWNPGGMGMLEYNEIMFLHSFLFEGTIYDYVSFCYPTIDVGTFGGGFIRIGTGDIIFRDSHNLVTSEDVSFEQMQFLIGYGIKLNLPFSFGTAIKINTFKVGQFSDANISFDIGILMPLYGYNWKKIFKNYYLENLKLGINVKNFVSTPIKLQTEAEADQLNIKIGLSYFYYFDKKLNHKILPTFDINFYKDKNIKINTGIEYNLYKMIFIRGGYDQNIGLVMGCGIQYWDFRLDYSLAFQEINLTHRFSLLWRFGESVEQQRASEKERYRQEIEERVKITVEKQTREYKERLSKLEAKYKGGIQKAIDELTAKYEKEKEKLIKEMTLSSDEIKHKLIQDLEKKYEEERIKTLTILSNKFETERKKMTEELDNKLKAERSKLKKQLTADDQFKRHHYTKGIELYEKGDYDGAITEFNSVLRFDPDYIEASEYLKKAKGAKKKPSTYPKKIMDLYYKGIDFYVAGEYKKSVIEWKKILRIDPYNKLALRNIRDAERKIKELEKIRKLRKRTK